MGDGHRFQRRLGYRCSVLWGFRRWKTPSPSGRLARCSTPSTRKRVVVARPAPAPHATRTLRGRRARWGVQSATSTGSSRPPSVASMRRWTTDGWCNVARTGWGTSASSAPGARGARRACWRMGSGDNRWQGRRQGGAHVPSARTYSPFPPPRLPHATCCWLPKRGLARCASQARTRIPDAPDAAVGCTESGANGAGTPAAGPPTRCPALAAARCPAPAAQQPTAHHHGLGRGGGAQQGAEQDRRVFMQRPGNQQRPHRRFHTDAVRTYVSD